MQVGNGIVENMKKKNEKQNFDYPLLFSIAILVIIGILMVFSSSVIMAEARWKTPYLFVVKHIIWIILGSVLMYLFAHFNFENLQKFAKPAFFAGIFLLIFVLIFGVERSGAKRWISFGFASFQPSELAKLALIIAIADYIDRKKSRLKQWQGIIPAVIMIIAMAGLVLIEPDLGTPIIMVIVGLTMLFFAGASTEKIVTLCVLTIPLGLIEILRKPYRIQRIKSFLYSWVDLESSSYQLKQSLLAFGAGGFLGKGLAQGQFKLLHLPEPHTDFIFPIIGEELGFLGVLFVIFLFVMFTWRGWRIGLATESLFGSMLAFGITLTIIFQAIINMGVACGVFPTKGLPLPFVSFGGTALVVNMIEIGILLNISKGKIKQTWARNTKF